MRIEQMINELNSTNSTNDKVEILKKYPDQQELLKWVYSPFIQFHVTSKNILKTKGKLEVGTKIKFNELGKLLYALSQRVITGHEALVAVHDFLDATDVPEEIILNIIDKNLKCRIDAKLINKAFPNCIPEFNVALAKDINKVPKSAKPVFEKGEWFASRKLDGVRCIAIKEGNHVQFYSRTGKEFFTLDKIKEAILQEKFPENCVLDGEICLFDKEGNDYFQGIMQEIRRKDHVIENPKYMIFDALTLTEFYNQKSSRKLVERFAHLELFFNKNSYLELVKQIQVSSNEYLNFLSSQAAELGWEGLMIRKNVGYEGKRSNNLLKVKLFNDDEYEIIDIEIGKMRFIEAGKEVEQEVMLRANIMHKGYKVGVGSGWSIAQRKLFKEKPESLIGKIVTIQFFEETTNKDGTISLRFPTVKCIHGDKREV